MDKQEDGSGNVRLERQVRLSVHEVMGMCNIDSDEPVFEFAIIRGMYQTGDGYGCSVAEERLREPTERMCKKIADAVKEYWDATA